MSNYGIETTDAAGQKWGINAWITRIIHEEFITQNKIFNLSNYVQEVSKSFLIIDFDDDDLSGNINPKFPLVTKSGSNVSIDIKDVTKLHVTIGVYNV